MRDTYICGLCQAVCSAHVKSSRVLVSVSCCPILPLSRAKPPVGGAKGAGPGPDAPVSMSVEAMCSESTQSLLGTLGSQCFRLRRNIFLEESYIYTERCMNHTFRAQEVLQNENTCVTTPCIKKQNLLAPSSARPSSHSRHKASTILTLKPINQLGLFLNVVKKEITEHTNHSPVDGHLDIFSLDSL